MLVADSNWGQRIANDVPVLDTLVTNVAICVSAAVTLEVRAVTRKYKSK